MNAPETEFVDGLREITLLIFDSVSTKHRDAWQMALFDVRRDPSGEAGHYKLRVRKDESSIVSEYVPYGVMDHVRSLWKIRDQTLAGMWFGLRITIFPGGRCDTAFIYDPGTIDDESFFKNKW